MYANTVLLLSLGLQSSGKSTLLNAMFGTQFSTSVGLCTDGLNGQLIPIPANITKTGYTHILLIDTKVRSHSISESFSRALILCVYELFSDILHKDYLFRTIRLSKLSWELPGMEGQIQYYF